MRIINSKCVYTLCFLFVSLQKDTKDVYTLFVITICVVTYFVLYLR